MCRIYLYIYKYNARITHVCMYIQRQRVAASASVARPRRPVAPPASRLRSALLVKTICRIRRSIFRSRPPELRCTTPFLSPADPPPKKKVRAAGGPFATPSRSRGKRFNDPLPPSLREIVTGQGAVRPSAAGHVYTVVRIFRAD